MKLQICLLSLISVVVMPALPDGSNELDFKHLKSNSFVAELLRQRQQINTPRISSRTLIVGGEEATPHQFPYQVTINVRNYFEGYDHNCGGVIYDENYILTAAHCVRGYHIRNLRVVAGEHDLSQDEGPEQHRGVHSYLFHPGYDYMTLENDIGIIQLDHPLDLNDKVSPLRLPTEVMVNPRVARNSGWGKDGVTEELQLRLRFVDLSIFTEEECREAYEFVAPVSSGMLCAGDVRGGKGSCSGDSGSPLICKDRLNGEEEYLCGLVSWGMIPCGTSQYPSVFTDVNTYIDWLHGLLPPQKSFPLKRKPN